jgi:hypothetical protein
MPRHGATTLGDLAGKLDYLQIECSACGRTGQYRVLRLIAELGNDLTLVELRKQLTTNCSKREGPDIHTECKAVFPGLGTRI